MLEITVEEVLKACEVELILNGHIQKKIEEKELREFLDHEKDSGLFLFQS